MTRARVQRIPYAVHAAETARLHTAIPELVRAMLQHAENALEIATDCNGRPYDSPEDAAHGTWKEAAEMVAALIGADVRAFAPEGAEWTARS